MKAQWQQEKEAIKTIRDLKEQLEKARLEEQEAERRGDLARVAEIRYGRLLELKKKLDEGDNHLAEIQKTAQFLKEEVDDQDVAEVISAWTGIPVTRMLEGEMQKLVHMEERLRMRVVGQEEALAAVSNSVRRARSGISDPDRPTGSFIFLGPTGVGKTELAKALAEFLFDDEKALIRLDMSEYMEKHTVARLIGAPPGYVGYDEGGQLTEAVRRRPYSVLLFDEIEKAHYDVFNVLLQILDDGRLTDGHGRTVDFKNTLIIMTSNVGSNYIQEMSGKNPQEIRAKVMEVMKASFRPEFLNRVDEIIIFNNLTHSDILKIVDMQMELLKKRLAARRISIEVTPETKEFLTRKGFDPVYGARPLKRVLQKYVQDRIAMEILEGAIKEGDSLVVDVDPENDEALTFSLSKNSEYRSQNTEVRSQ
jgi:ATP-dependent Clp protease ATP-binding subunit ClpB